MDDWDTTATIRIAGNDGIDMQWTWQRGSVEPLLTTFPVDVEYLDFKIMKMVQGERCEGTVKDGLTGTRISFTFEPRFEGENDILSSSFDLSSVDLLELMDPAPPDELDLLDNGIKRFLLNSYRLYGRQSKLAGECVVKGLTQPILSPGGGKEPRPAISGLPSFSPAITILRNSHSSSWVSTAMRRFSPGQGATCLACVSRAKIQPCESCGFISQTAINCSWSFWGKCF